MWTRKEMKYISNNLVLKMDKNQDYEFRCLRQHQPSKGVSRVHTSLNGRPETQRFCHVWEVSDNTDNKYYSKHEIERTVKDLCR